MEDYIAIVCYNSFNNTTMFSMTIHVLLQGLDFPLHMTRGYACEGEVYALHVQ